MNYNFKIIDCTQISAVETVKLLEMIWLGICKSRSRSDYYCGIAQDPNGRLQDHERDDWTIAEVVAVVNCGTQDKAAEVEGLMAAKGFDVGDTTTPGNGGSKDSIYVYLVRKGCDTLKSFLKNIIGK